MRIPLQYTGTAAKTVKTGRLSAYEQHRKDPRAGRALIAALITLYLYFNPTALAHAEYSLGIDGIVVARTLCLLFALWQIVHLAEDIFKKD